MLEKFRPVSCRSASFERSSANRIVKANELGAIGKRRFHLHLMDHFRDAFHDPIATQDLAAFGHQFGDRLAVACSLEDEICNEGDTLGIVELDPSTEPASAAYPPTCDHHLLSFPHLT